MSGAFLIGRGPDGKDRPAVVNSDGALKVDIGNATLSVTAEGVEIKNDSGNPVPVASGLEIPKHDYIGLTYDGSNNLTGVVYKINGASGTTVATLSLTYSGGNLTSVSRT